MAADQTTARDGVIRQAAFDHVRALQSRDLVLSHDDIARGFVCEGQRWPLWNPQRGIFKPRGMPFLLSIRTVFPKKGRAGLVRRSTSGAPPYRSRPRG
jgi:putative restriction endonuclease